jgi:hypothetical protein
MKHNISLEKSDIVSMGPGIDYVLGEKEDVKGDGILTLDEMRAYTAKRKHVILKKTGKGLTHVRTMKFRGLPINIEIDAGMTAEGVDPNGKPWQKNYLAPYGEIDKTIAQSDGDPVDVYIGPFEKAEHVYVVHQLKKDGTYDEDKVMLGFPGAAEARDCYEIHGPSWGFGSMEKLTWDQFVNGYLASNRDPKLIVKEHRSNG